MIRLSCYRNAISSNLIRELIHHSITYLFIEWQLAGAHRGSFHLGKTTAARVLHLAAPLRARSSGRIG